MIQFNLSLGEQSKIYGMNLIELHCGDFCETMRKVARGMIKEKGSITCDDLRRFANKHGIEPHHPNAWGAIFRTKDFIMLGYKKSQLLSNHARRIAIWGSQAI